MFIQKFRLAGLMLVCFLLGAVFVTGYDSLALDSPNRPRGRVYLMDNFSQALDLTEEQKDRLDEILEDGRERMVELNRSSRPQFHMIKAETYENIRGILSSEQVVRFNSMIEEQEKKRQERNHRRHGCNSENIQGVSCAVEV